jgi:hypothetical protein
LKLKEAARLYADMLDYINEYKRRHELVAKYLRADQADATEMMKKLTMKTIVKKSNRITLQLSNALGLRNSLVKSLFSFYFGNQFLNSSN